MNLAEYGEHGIQDPAEFISRNSRIVPHHLGIDHGIAVNMEMGLISYAFKSLGESSKPIHGNGMLSGHLVDNSFVAPNDVPERRALGIVVQDPHSVSENVIVESVRCYSEEIEAVRGAGGMQANKRPTLQDRVVGLCHVAAYSCRVPRFVINHVSSGSRITSQLSGRRGAQRRGDPTASGAMLLGAPLELLVGPPFFRASVSHLHGESRLWIGRSTPPPWVRPRLKPSEHGEEGASEPRLSSSS